MKYTTKQIDRMTIESIEALANYLTAAELQKWAGSYYNGKCYVAIIKSRKYTPKLN